MSWYSYSSFSSSIRDTSRVSFQRDGRIRKITPRRMLMSCCNKIPWKGGCFGLLILVLVGAVVPFQLPAQKNHRTISNATFTIEDQTIGGKLHAKVLKNTKTGEYVEVITDYGGRVENLYLKSQSGKTVWPVLLSHNGNASAIIENKWWRGMLLIPWANRIAYGKYTFFNDSYQLPVNENTTNPRRVNALHGFMPQKFMNVNTTKIASNYALLGLSYSFTAQEKGYPFCLDVFVSYNLSTTGFNMSFKITNRMTLAPLPLYVGWHPYFLCTPYSAKVILDKCLQWNHVELDANADPTGISMLYHGFNGSAPIGGNKTNPTPYDDEFKPRSGPTTCDVIETQVYDAETNHTIVLWQDSSFRFVHVFTVENAIAVEPMSAMADAYNNHDHLTVLSGGETWSGSIGVYIK